MPRHIVVRGPLTDSLERVELRNEDKPVPTLSMRQQWREQRERAQRAVDKAAQRNIKR
jgi:hypothetical protein